MRTLRDIETFIATRFIDHSVVVFQWHAHQGMDWMLARRSLEVIGIVRCRKNQRRGQRVREMDGMIGWENAL